MSDSSATTRFHTLIWPHRAAVLRAAHILTGQAADAEDLAQDTLLKAFRSIDQFRDGTNVRAWLMTILRNTRIDRLRSLGPAARNVSLQQLEIDIPDAPPEPDADIGTEEILDQFSDKQVIDALQELPEDIRWTLLLVDVQGQEMKDAAVALAVPVGTVKSRLHRGRRMLRHALADLARQLRLMP